MNGINFNDLASIRSTGFTGFIPVPELMKRPELIPDVRGVYFVIYTGKVKPIFSAKGTGGFFKGRDPNVPSEILESNWVDLTRVVYIGKAGGEGGNATLRSRIRQYLRFGNGMPVGHYGGRYIWQIKDKSSLTFCWKPLPGNEPRAIENELIIAFRNFYGKLPFANLKE